MPTVLAASMTTSDHRRNAHVVFYRIGLGDHDNDTYVPRFNKYVKEKTFWTLRTLKTLVTALGHAEVMAVVTWGPLQKTLPISVLRLLLLLLLSSSSSSSLLLLLSPWSLLSSLLLLLFLSSSSSSLLMLS